MLGNEEDARFIRDWHIAITASEGDYDRKTGEYRSPEGWERLGSGCYRVAYLSPDGVVYKVQLYYAAPGRYEGQSNKTEVANLRKYWLTKMPEGCRLPRWGFFELDGRGVMAMEQFNKLLKQYSKRDAEGSRYWTALNRLQNVMCDMYDFHGGNLAVDEENQKLVPIDMGG